MKSLIGRRTKTRTAIAKLAELGAETEEKEKVVPRLTKLVAAMKTIDDLKTERGIPLFYTALF